MERIYQLESQIPVDWDKRIPDDINDDFYDSFMNQFTFFKSFDDLKVNELSWIL